MIKKGQYTKKNQEQLEPSNFNCEAAGSTTSRFYFSTLAELCLALLTSTKKFGVSR
jgi:hypothetical protein